MYTAIVRSWHVHQYLGFWLKLMLVTGISLNHDFIKQNNQLSNGHLFSLCCLNDNRSFPKLKQNLDFNFYNIAFALHFGVAFFFSKS